MARNGYTVQKVHVHVHVHVVAKVKDPLADYYLNGYFG
jgi:hypothetical protein